MSMSCRPVLTNKGHYLLGHYKPDPWDLLPVGIYFVSWLAIPFLFFENYSITFSAMWFGSFIIVALGCFAFVKWYLISQYLKKHFNNGGSDGGGGGGGPSGDQLAFILFLISISVFICWVLIDLKRNDIVTMFDVATLWSAVYGTIFGTACFLKTD